MSSLGIPVVSTCTHIYICVFFLLFSSWFSFNLHMPGQIIFSLHYTVYFHCVFDTGMCHFLLLPSLFSCAALYTPPPHAHSFAAALALTGCAVSWCCLEQQQNCVHTWNVSSCTDLRLPVMVSQRLENFPEIQTSLSQ